MHNFLNIYQSLSDDATKIVYIAHFCPHFMDTESAGIPHGIPLFDTETDCENKISFFVKKYNKFLNDNISLIENINTETILIKKNGFNKENYPTLEIRMNLINFPGYPEGFEVALLTDNIEEQQIQEKEKISEAVIKFIKIMKKDLKKAS